MSDLQNLSGRLHNRYNNWQNERLLMEIAQQVALHAQPRPGQAPVIFFNASTRLGYLSLNAAFSLLTSWSLQLAGVPVVHFVCQAGLSRCVLGTDWEHPEAEPPCTRCQALSDKVFRSVEAHPFHYTADPLLSASLQGLGVEQLSRFEFPASFLPGEPAIPLGRLALPSLRWAMRRHHLRDDEATRFLFSEYLLSAYHLAQEFAALIERSQPAAAVLFNGTMYPEATARWVAAQYSLHTVTHEVSFQPFSAFFTSGEATAYPLDIPDDFELGEQENERLDQYLERRFQGKFTMAGIRFWSEMRGLDPAFLEKATRFRQIVPVFTNVVFDTSQVHANTVFSNMFEWLEVTLELIKAYPDTLFVLRAHPDEMRPKKESQESVREWVQKNGVDRLPNVVFIDSQEQISSYELIERAKFVMVYNSSIGLEAALLGAAVLCGGKARYTQLPVVFFPDSPSEYAARARAFLDADRIEVPEAFARNARRFLYYQFYRASLPFDQFLENGILPGFVHFRAFDWRDLLPERSPTLQIVQNGILNGGRFFIGEASHAESVRG